MTSTSNDMPPRQPNEPADHPVRDELDIIDETVARIADADIDKHLRQVLDRAGYRARLTPGVETPPQTGERPAATRCRRSLSWSIVALAGAAPEIVDQVPVERAKFESRGLAVLLSSVIAVASMWFALTASGVSGILAAPAGLLGGLTVMGIDRWLVTSMPLGGGWRRLAAAGPRLALALLLGTLISAPMVLHLFRQPIDGEISAIRQHQLSAFHASPQYTQLNQRVISLPTRVNGLTAVVTSKGHAFLTPSADLLLQDLMVEQAFAVALEQQGIPGYACPALIAPGCQTPLHPASASAQAVQDSEHAAESVSVLTNQIKIREEQLIASDTTAAKNRLNEARETLPAVKEELTRAQANLTKLDETFRAQNNAGGALLRLEALNQLSDPTRSASLLLFLLLLMIECLPVTVALVQRPGGYEKILARMIVDGRLKIEEVPDAGPGLTEGTPSAQPGSGTSPVTVPDQLRDEIESISLFMTDTTELTVPAYREELENCFVSISQAVNELSRKGFDSDQIAEVVRITADTATRQLAATWEERWRANSLR
jgi:hypothetical protein